MGACLAHFLEARRDQYGWSGVMQGVGIWRRGQIGKQEGVVSPVRFSKTLFLLCANEETIGNCEQRMIRVFRRITLVAILRVTCKGPSRLGKWENC